MLAGITKGLEVSSADKVSPWTMEGSSKRKDFIANENVGREVR